MYSEDLELLRQQLLDVNFEIAKIEKNHHLETESQKQEAEKELKYLYEKQEMIRSNIKKTMLREIENQNYETRGSFGGRGI